MLVKTDDTASAWKTVTTPATFKPRGQMNSSPAGRSPLPVTWLARSCLHGQERQPCLGLALRAALPSLRLPASARDERAGKVPLPRLQAQATMSEGFISASDCMIQTPSPSNRRSPAWRGESETIPVWGAQSGLRGACPERPRGSVGTAEQGGQPAAGRARCAQSALLHQGQPAGPGSFFLGILGVLGDLNSYSFKR